MRALVVLLFLVSVLQLSCAASGSVAVRNRARIAELSIGMPRAKVLEVMGTSVVAPDEVPGEIRNPHRVETLRGNEGAVYEVLFYCTSDDPPRGVITNDELTPLILKNGTLLGWGWSLLGKKLYGRSERP